jgi:serine/threonine protein kinase
VGELAPDERESCERHLETCPACQEYLDRTERLEGMFATLGREFGDPTVTPADPTLTRFLGRLNEVHSPAQILAHDEPAELHFLTPTDRADLLGTLGDYEVEAVIGQGGMGVVLQAFEPALHRLVAIKVLAPALAGSATARRRFTREAQAAAAVCHEHVVAVHGVHEADGLPYLVMQYIPGESLQTRLDRIGPLDLAETVRIGMQTASGLAAAHAQGLIHRDIKPANLLLENGLARVKISDFGLARMADDVGLTRDGVVAGTPEYMAPEQARGETVDHRADLFSLGSVLYALCTGRPPFRASTALAVLRQVNDEEPSPIRELNPDVPEWLETFIARLMAKDPTQRFQSAAEVAALLEGYLGHLRQPATLPAPALPLRLHKPEAPTRAAPARKRGNRSPRWRFGLVTWVATALTLAALGLILSFWQAGGANSPQPEAPARGNAPKEYFHSFVGENQSNEDFRLDGLDPEQCVQFEPAGLRITLPVGHEGRRIGTGLASNFAIKGDFEITMSYEILQEPESADAGRGTEVYLWVDLDEPAVDRVMLFRGVASRKRYVAARFLPGERMGKPGTPPRWSGGPPLPTAAMKGRLRLVRTGATLFYYVAENADKDFTLLDQHPVGTEDGKMVRIGGITGGPQASLDARILDLSIRSESLPGAPEKQAEASGQPEGKGWWAFGVILGLLLIVALTLGAGFYLRHRSRSAASRRRNRPFRPRSPSCVAVAGRP